MRLFNLLTLIGGLAIFGWILSRADLAAVTEVTGRLGSFGAAAILATFGLAMISGAIAWALMFRSTAPSAAWSARLWLLAMVGEAFNMLTPFGAFGGEPFKALLLKRHYGISYTEGTASLVLIQTVNSLAQVPFAIIGVILMLRAGSLPEAIATGLVAATGVISALMTFVYLALHYRLLAKLPTHLKNGESAANLTRAIAFLTDLEERLFHFVRNTPGRSAAALTFVFLSWTIGAAEIYLVFALLDAPISFSEAWIVETAIILVRSATFFVPAHIGVQDGVLTMVGQALTGSSEVGLAVALIRRGRELFWAGVGLLIYAAFNLRDRTGA